MVAEAVARREATLHLCEVAQRFVRDVENRAVALVKELVQTGSPPPYHLALLYIKEAFTQMSPLAIGYLMSNWDSIYYHCSCDENWSIPLHPGKTTDCWIDVYSDGRGRAPVWIWNLLIAFGICPKDRVPTERSKYLIHFAQHVEAIHSVPGFLILYNKSKIYQSFPHRLRIVPPEFLEAKRIQEEGVRRRWKALVASWVTYSREMEESSLWYVE